MDVKNVGNETFKITASYSEVAKIVTALNEHNVKKKDEALAKIAYSLMNPAVKSNKGEIRNG